VSSVRIVRWDPADTDTAMACYEVHLAAHLTDTPQEPPESAGTFGCWLREGWDCNPGEVWLIPGEGNGTVVAFYRIDLPDLENLDRGFAQPVVHPGARRGGLGRALVRHAAERAASNGRVVIDSVAIAGSAGDAFARRIGAALTLVEIQRMQHLSKISPEQVADLRETVARAAAGYSLVTWTGPVPEEFLAQAASVFNAFGDAPRGEGIEAEAWDAQRVRERTGSVLRAGHLRGYTVAALHDATGEMAAITEVVIDPLKPDWGFQGLTAVTRPHRGHRLGLLVKAAMLQWLAAAEPQLERIETGNAAVNDHMIAVNDTLGYEVSGTSWHFYEIAVADAAQS
jgi:GNAT superfamily N-acetyltransferase